MSSLWTPGGEHPVEREPSTPPPSEPAPGPAGATQAPSGAPGGAASGGLPPTIPGPDGEPISIEDLTPEQRAELEAQVEEMARVREQVSQTPAYVVVANHVMGLYELAAIHLSANPPNFSEASVAIDALTAVVDKLEGRLGEAEPQLVEARAGLQQAFVALKQQAGEAGAPG